MKILFMIGSLEVGGSEKQLVELAKNLKQYQHEVFIVSIKGGELVSELVENNIPHLLFHQESRRNRKLFKSRIVILIKTIYKTFYMIKKFEPDVFHSWLYHASLIGIPIAKSKKVSIVISSRRGLHNDKNYGFLRRLGDLWINKISDIVTVNSKAGLRELSSNDSLLEKKVQYIPNGVYMPDKIFEKSNVPIRGICVSNLIEYKGHRDLLQALSTIEDDFKFEIIGEGPMRGTIENDIEILGLQRKVSLTGQLLDPKAKYLQSDFFVLPSHTEATSNALLEAKAHRLPVVVTSVGDASVLVEDGFNGFIVPPHSPKLLGEKILIVIRNQALRSVFSANSLKGLEKYSWQSVTENYLNVYTNKN